MIRITHAQLRFNHISGEDGLSHNTIRSVIQNKEGFIWIGTYNGINKYDGYRMQHYNFSNTENGLSSNIIITLFEDKKGNIWAGTTDAGINRIDKKTEKVDVYFNDRLSSDYISEVPRIFQDDSGVMFFQHNSGIKAFIVDDDGNLLYEKVISSIKGKHLQIQDIVSSVGGKHWLFTPLDSIKLSKLILNKKSDSLSVEIKETNIRYLRTKDENIVNIFEYQKNTLWMITDRLKLIRISLDKDLKEIDREYIDLKKYNKSLPDKKYSKLNIVVDKSKNLWIGREDVLIRYNTESSKVQFFENKNIPKDIYDIYIDYSNILWIGTMNNGLYNADLNNKTFFNSKDYIRDQAFNKYPVLAITEDDLGNIWFGFQKDGGLFTISEDEIVKSLNSGKDKGWMVKRIDDQWKNVSLTEIKRLIKDHKGNIWIGSRGAVSKVVLDPGTKKYKITTFDKVKDKEGKTIINTAFALEEDSKGNIWAGYWIDGLVKLEFNDKGKLLKTTNYQFSKEDPGSLSNNYIRDILEDSKGRIWIGTVGGLNKLVYNDQGEPSFEHYLFSAEDEESLSNNYVLDIFESREGDIYVGTFGGGLDKLQFSKEGKVTFKHYTVKDGLPSDVIFQIREDKDGHIWMQHVREISKLDLKTEEIKYFDSQDGFSVKEFKENTMIYSKNGLIFSAGVNGFTFFRPDKMTVNRIKPKLAIEDFKLFHESVKPLEKVKDQVILEKDINDTKKIVLPYYLNSIEFVFSSLHFSNPDKNQYKYMLEGFNDKWQYSKGNERRFASYTNVPPGNYNFKVYGSNSSGIWTDAPKQIEIVINSPWYLTPWYIMLYILLTFIILYSLIRIRMNQIRLQSQLELEGALHEKSKEINKMKLQFFTNISHELRTPLTLIIGPLQQIMQGNKDPVYLKKLNTIMYKNSLRLLKLINQLLDFRKAESGEVNLIVKNDDLVEFVGGICNAFEEVAGNKEIKFVYLPEEEKIDAWFDSDKMEKVLYNLLSNAFKYTPRFKSVKVTVRKIIKEGIDHAVIKVTDYGIGIPEDELNSIFERFYQAKKEDNIVNVGSGLGLAYTRQLVEIHKGEITIESKLHEGTTCTIEIPVSRSAYDEESILETQINHHDFRYTKKEIEDMKDLAADTVVADEDQVKDQDAPTVLIVEDNKELQNYMYHYFNQNYHVLVADNGKIGLELSKKNSPDIIISDLMMPVMDGIEMCKLVKTDITTSHIPVIILTAKAGIENEKEGLETGADEFVLKPFHIEILKLRLENILKTRRKWKEKYQKNADIIPVSGLSNTLDKKFLEKAVNIVKDNLDNPDFSVEVFTSEIAMSRSTLFKKLKSVTGLSTSEFIRSIRIKKAAKYLRSGEYSITEVIFMVGFSDPKYFRTCFKKQFDKNPSEYLKSFKN
jgi:signal transduction histidine kinase/ligand-binding sensor domain-containing protein/DNA-binding response OmpR family regulator